MSMLILLPAQELPVDFVIAKAGRLIMTVAPGAVMPIVKRRLAIVVTAIVAIEIPTLFCV